MRIEREREREEEDMFWSRARLSLARSLEQVTCNVADGCRQLLPLEAGWGCSSCSSFGSSFSEGCYLPVVVAGLSAGSGRQAGL